ncbi:hypothetical protein [Streptomyces coffeae]|uniref:hypothetical protein n=1 Tax=Streptomyces coffeae TaxID=621382 RepID=UPI0027DE0B23|nr:hypothetical protein [Streptomyces coffeae]
MAFDGPGAVGLVESAAMVRVGKTAAGRLLDGRMWDEFPPRRAQGSGLVALLLVAWPAALFRLLSAALPSPTP